MTGSGLQPLAGVLILDSTADLQPARPRRESFLGGLPVSWSEHDHVPTEEPVLTKFLRKPARGLI